MQILIKSGLIQQTLCHGHVTGPDRHVGPQDLLVAGPIAAQVAETIRATNALVYHRGNLQTAITFSVTRECASPQAAELFCFTHPRDVLREDTLIILAQTANGGTSKLTLAGAAIQDVQCRQVGLSVLVSYNIIGGALT